MIVWKVGFVSDKLDVYLRSMDTNATPSDPVIAAMYINDAAPRLTGTV